MNYKPIIIIIIPILQALQLNWKTPKVTGVTEAIPDRMGRSIL